MLQIMLEQSEISARIFFPADRDPSSYAQYITIGDSDSWPSKWGLNTHIVKKNSDSFIIIELQDSKIIWSSPEY